MEGELPRKRYFLGVALIFAAVAFALVMALCVALERRLFSNGAMLGVLGTLTATWMPIAVAVFLPIGIAIAVAMRKFLQRPNYPRIEHLRIAGKYVPASPAKMGVSPLYLK